MYIEVKPAYGRDYKSQKEVRADWNGGKDFQMTDTGQYIGKAEAEAEGLSVIVRYGKLMKVMDVTR